MGSDVIGYDIMPYITLHHNLIFKYPFYLPYSPGPLGGGMMVTYTSKEDEYKDDIVRMLHAFIRCRMFSIVDKLANATSKVVVEQALYEALRISRAAYESFDGSLCELEGGKAVKAYVAREESIRWLQELLRQDVIRGLEVCKEIASRALSFPVKVVEASA
ncbi:MAG: hypothetical protein ACO2O2_01535 [Acidilobaceae archaeon]